MLSGRRKYRTLSDEALLEQWSQHPRRVLAELYERYSVLGFGLCLKYMREREKARDMVSEIFLKLPAKLDHHSIHNFRSWFYTFAKNQCLEHIRREKVRDLNRNELKWVIQQPGWEEIDEMEMEWLEEGLALLQPDQQKCIHDFYYARRSYVEIADQNGLSLKQVKSHIQNARRNLKIHVAQRSKESLS